MIHHRQPRPGMFQSWREAGLVALPFALLGAAVAVVLIPRIYRQLCGWLGVLLLAASIVFAAATLVRRARQ